MNKQFLTKPIIQILIIAQINMNEIMAKIKMVKIIMAKLTMAKL